MFYVFMHISSHRNTRESLGETRKNCGNIRPSARVPTTFLVLSNFHSCFYLAIRLFALNFYEVIVDETEARSNYHLIEIESE